MKALTLWPEWAWAICHLDKRIENRIWFPPWGFVGQDIAIHAGAHIGGRKMSVADQHGPMQGVCEMAVDTAGWACTMKFGEGLYVLSKGDGDRLSSVSFKQSEVVRSAVVAVAKLSKVTGGSVAKEWAVPGQYHWHLEDVRVLEEPVSCRGYQKLWTLPNEVEYAVRIQI